MLNISVCSSLRTKRDPLSSYVSVTGNFIVPNAPLVLSAIGGVGQFTLTFEAVTTLVQGDPISVDPITNYRIYWGPSEASVKEGGTPTGSGTTTGTSFNQTGLTAGTWWVSVVANNAAGPSDRSFTYQVTAS